MTDAPTCRHCGRAVRWIVVDGGRREALNPEPEVEQGDVLIVKRKQRTFGRRLSGDRLERARDTDLALYRSHFATCPKAETWRKP